MNWATTWVVTPSAFVVVYVYGVGPPGTTGVVGAGCPTGPCWPTAAAVVAVAVVAGIAAAVVAAAAAVVAAAAAVVAAAAAGMVCLRSRCMS